MRLNIKHNSLGRDAYDFNVIICNASFSKKVYTFWRSNLDSSSGKNVGSYKIFDVFAKENFSKENTIS